MGAVADPDAGLGSRRVLDRAVASVGGSVVTRSEVEFDARVLLVARGSVEAAGEPLDEARLRSALLRGLEARALTADAERLETHALSQGELTQALAAFRGRFPSPAAYESFLTRQEVSDDDVVRVLARDLRAERVLEAKLRLRAQPTEAEVQRALRERVDVRGLSAREVARVLASERFEALRRAEVQTAWRRAEVRLLGSFAVPEPQGAL